MLIKRFCIISFPPPDGCMSKYYCYTHFTDQLGLRDVVWLVQEGRARVQGQSDARPKTCDGCSGALELGTPHTHTHTRRPGKWGMN